MSKAQRSYWFIVVETTEVEKHGPYLDERVADEAAKEFIKETMKTSPIRVQNMRIMLMVVYSASDFRFEIYEPNFILDLIK